MKKKYIKPETSAYDMEFPSLLQMSGLRTLGNGSDGNTPDGDGEHEYTDEEEGDGKTFWYYD